MLGKRVFMKPRHLTAKSITEVKAVVDNYGPEKSVKQINAKLGRLKNAYKQVIDNSRTRAAPQSCSFTVILTSY